MSKTEIEHSETSDDAGDEHDHPSDNKYIQIAIILAVITALEVARISLKECQVKF